MMLDVLLHTILGCVAAATGYIVRSSCAHRGWLPHPKAHIILTIALVAVESFVAVSLVG